MQCEVTHIINIIIMLQHFLKKVTQNNGRLEILFPGRNLLPCICIADTLMSILFIPILQSLKHMLYNKNIFIVIVSQILPLNGELILGNHVSLSFPLSPDNDADCPGEGRSRSQHVIAQ